MIFNMKKRIFKGFFTIAVLLTVILSTSCSNVEITVVPPCVELFPSEVELEFAYLNNCTFFPPETEQPMKIEITVDGISLDGSNVKTTYLKNVSFNRTNAHDNSITLANRKFPIDLPRCGSYVVQVVARGTDASCFKCCATTSGSTNICPTPFPPIFPATGDEQSGQIRFRAVSPQINATAANPPPTLIRVTPIKEQCTCGC
jgi:hypothetical protein